MFALLVASCGTDGLGWSPEGPPELVENPADVEGRAVDVFVSDGADIEYFLSRIPAPDTIEVALVWPNGEWMALHEATCCPPIGDFVYEGERNSITLLTLALDVGDVLRVEYWLAGTEEDFDR